MSTLGYMNGFMKVVGVMSAAIARAPRAERTDRQHVRGSG